MKKYSLYLLPLLALGALTSCEEDPFKGVIQENPQEEVMSVDAVNVAFALGDALDLNNYTTTDVKVINSVSINAPEGLLSSGAYTSFEMQLSATSDFQNYYTFPVVDGAVSGVDWETCFVAMYGRKPVPNVNYVRFIGYIHDGDNSYRIGDGNHYLGTKQITVSPVDLGFVIEDNYYLLSDATGWNFDGTPEQKFSHSDVNVYDDPVFTIIVEVTGEACYWKVAPQSTIDAADWGATFYGTVTDGDTALSGRLTDVNPQAGKIEGAGKYEITVNMETLDYSIKVKAYPEALAVRDQAYEWSGTNTQWLAVKGESKYYGTAYIDPIWGFKLTDAADGDGWDNNWGGGASAGLLAANSSNNITVTENGEALTATALYWISADLAELTYTVQEITSIGVIGALTSWNDKEPIEMAPTEDPRVWSVNVPDLTGEWKIIINHSWGSNYGGSIDAPVFDGGNFSGFDGNYNVSIDFNGHYPVIKVEAAN